MAINKQNWIIGGGHVKENNSCYFVALDVNNKIFYYCMNGENIDLFRNRFEIIAPERVVDITLNKINNTILIAIARSNAKYIVELERNKYISTAIAMIMMRSWNEPAITVPLTINVNEREKFKIGNATGYANCSQISNEILTIVDEYNGGIETIERGELLIRNEKLSYYNVVKICYDAYYYGTSCGSCIIALRDIIRANVIIVNYKHLWCNRFKPDDFGKLDMASDNSVQNIKYRNVAKCEGSLYIIIVVDGQLEEIPITLIGHDEYEISKDKIRPDMWAKTWVSVRDHTIGYASGHRAFIVGNCKPHTRKEDTAYYLNININNKRATYFDEWYSLRPTTAIEDGYLISTKVTPEDVERNPSGAFVRLLDEFNICSPDS